MSFGPENPERDRRSSRDETTRLMNKTQQASHTQEQNNLKNASDMSMTPLNINGDPARLKRITNQESLHQRNFMAFFLMHLQLDHGWQLPPYTPSFCSSSTEVEVEEAMKAASEEVECTLGKAGFAVPACTTP